METLLEDYKRRLDTAKEMLAELSNEEIDDRKRTRLATKMSCYRTFIVELERELKNL